MVVLSAVGSGCVITQNVEVTCMRQHKRTNLLETYLPVGTFRNELFYVTGPRGLLQKKVRFETYLPVGTFPRGWYVYMIFHDIYTDFYTVSEVG